MVERTDALIWPVGYGLSSSASPSSTGGVPCVDVGAREEINALLRTAAAAGAVVIFLSTDPEELARGCDRVVVFYRGSICGELSGPDLTASALLHLMNTGAVEGAAA